MPDGQGVGGVYGVFDLDTKGAERRLKAIEAQMQSLQGDLQVGAKGLDAFEREMESLSREAEQLRGSLELASQGVKVFSNRSSEARAATEVFIDSTGKARDAMGRFVKTGGDATATFGAIAGGGRSLQGFGNDAERMGRLSGASTQRLMVMAQTMDDLQYVGQMGLRPIINNITQLSPTIGIALISFELLRKGIGAAFSAMDESGGLNAFSTDVEKLTARVEELGGAWFKSADSIRQYQQAKTDLKNAEGAAKAVEVESDRESGNASGFRKAAGEAGGGNVAEAAVRELVQARFGENTVAAIRYGIEQNLFSTRELYQAGIRPGDNASVANAVENNPGFVAGARDRVVESRTNELMAGLVGGDQGTLDAVLGMAGGSGMADSPFFAALGRESFDATEAKQAEDDRAKADEKAAQESRQTLAQVEQAQQQARADMERRAADLSGPLQGRFNRVRLSGQEPGTDDVRNALAGAGVDESTVGELAGFVEVQLDKGFEEAVRKRALADRVPPEEARAAMGRDQAAADEAEAVKAAKEADPEVAKRAEREAIKALLSGKSGAEATKAVGDSLAGSLKSAGLSDEQAATAAAKYAREGVLGGGDVVAGFQEKALQIARDARRGPETFDAGALLERVQAGVGNESRDQKLLDLNQKMADYLRKIAEREQREDVTHLS